MISTVTLWFCPTCDAAARTVDTKLPHHPCPGRAGLMLPLLREGERSRLVQVDRDDYVGNDIVTTDETGRPIMAVTVEHDDGSEDRTVFAPTATISAEEIR